MERTIDKQLYKELCDVVDIEQELKKYTDYDILYNFSTARKNLYDWFEFNKDAKLLELGGECGVLTGYFGTKVSSVTSIEVDKDRYEICNYRYKDSKNIKVINSDFESFKTDEKYDYIILTGSLEDANEYMNGNKPYENLLTKAKSLLNEGGMIFVAVSNRMGLAYLSGEVESKVGKAFKGLEAKSGLFTRKQVLSIIENSKLEIVDTYYPMPDYRFVSVIYSDNYLLLPGDYHTESVSFSKDSYKTFDETSVADSLLESGEFIDHANSFLFILK